MFMAIRDRRAESTAANVVVMGRHLNLKLEPVYVKFHSSLYGMLFAQSTAGQGPCFID